VPDFATPTPQGLIDLAWATLLHSAWIGLLVGSLASSMIALGRPASPRARHAAIAASLLHAALAAPAAAVVQRSWRHHDAMSFYVGTTAQDVDPEPADSSGSRATPKSVASPGPEPAAAWSARLRRAIAAAASRLDVMRPYLLAAWAAGASAFAAALAVGAMALQRLGRGAAPRPALERRAYALGRKLRLRRTPAVREHPGIAEPCLVGILRPVVLLPSGWLATAPASQIDAVLAHELAHARRLDHRTNLLLRAIEAAFGFHPGVRLASRLARREAERAADALAVRLTDDPLALARALDSVARSLPSRPRSLRPGLAVGGERSALLPRIQELLGMKPARPRFPFRAVAALPAAAILAALATSAATAQKPPATDRESQVERLSATADDYEKIGKSAAARDDRGRTARLLASVDTPAVSKAEFLRIYRADPETLADEDLVKRLEAVRGPDPGLKGKPREELVRMAREGEVSFEVRFVEVVDVERDPFEDAPMAPVQPGVAWIAKPEELDAILKAVSAGVASRVTQAPKVTTFEGAGATIIVGAKPESFPIPKSSVEIEGVPASSAPAVSDPATVQLDLDGPPTRPGSGRVGGAGWAEAQRIDVRGTRSADGHRVAATLATRVRDVRFAAFGAKADVPIVAEPKAMVLKRTSDCDVPDGSSLVIASGFHGRWPGAAGALPRLVRNYAVVTPRRIDPEAIEAATLDRIEKAVPMR